VSDYQADQLAMFREAQRAQNLTAFPHMMSGLTGGVLIVRSARMAFDNGVPLNSAELVFEW
jgi:hypothetical protein